MSSNETCLAVAIADLIISEGPSFNIAQKLRFNNILYLARNISKVYNPPNIKIISKVLLYVIHYQNMQRNLTMMKKEAEIFGLLFICDGATVYRIPLLNILI